MAVILLYLHTILGTAAAAVVWAGVGGGGRLRGGGGWTASNISGILVVVLTCNRLFLVCTFPLLTRFV